MSDPWPHQAKAVEDVEAAIQRGERCICLTSPTGGGKTRIACDLIQRWTAQGLRSVVYTNRRLLVEQLEGVLTNAGIVHGVRAAGHDTNHGREVQIASVPTENARTLKSKQWVLHDAQRVLIDEAHLQTGKVAQKLLKAHLAADAALVGLTATPLDLEGMYDCLVQAGTTSELRACGALVWCRHYGCDEPDLSKIGRVELGDDLTEAQNIKAVMVPGIFARVLEWYKRLNPEGKPSILFAPGVGESLWFAEQFVKEGIPAAHVDGQEVWINGESQKTSAEARREALDSSRDGRIRVLCNRFVLREGIDAPWFAHGIFATVFGSLQSYLQSGGRLLRSSPGMASVTLQDHGGNWWRHGSLNADRRWCLGDTARIVSGLREERMRSRADREPIRCPRCGLILGGSKCLGCGFVLTGSAKSRPVVQADGSLKEMHGDVFQPRRISQKPNGPQLWERMYHRSRTGKGQRTFRAAMALFAQENNWGYPDPSWPLMPVDPVDWFKLVKDVPRERLT